MRFERISVFSFGVFTVSKPTYYTKQLTLVSCIMCIVLQINFSLLGIISAGDYGEGHFCSIPSRKLRIKRTSQTKSLHPKTKLQKNLREFYTKIKFL